jgi:hypothetical protein
MTNKIFFRFSGEEFLKRGYNGPFGYLALRDYGVDPDGTPLLSKDCTSLEQLEYQAIILKKEIDEAVNEGKKRLK